MGRDKFSDTAEDDDTNRERNDSEWRTSLKTFFFSFVVLVCLVLALSDGVVPLPRPNRDTARDYSIRVLLILVAMIFGWVLYHWEWTRLIANTGAKGDKITQSEGVLAAELQTHIQSDIESLDKEGVMAFVDLMVNPEVYRVRVAQTVDFAGRGLRERVDIEFELSASALTARCLYLPVLMPNKGELLDNFHLYDASGKSLANLSYEETSRLAAVGLWYLLLKGAPTESENVKVAYQILLEPVAKRGQFDQIMARQDIDERLKTIKIKLPDNTLKRVRAYLIALSVTYPIVIRIPSAEITAGRCMVSYELTSIPQTSSRGGFEGELRIALGLRPHQITIPVDLAYTTQSYHLRVNGPADNFLIRQYLLCSRCQALAKRRWRSKPTAYGDQDARERCPLHPGSSNDGKCHFRLRQRRGQSYVHLYMRGYANDAAPRDLQFLTRFQEIPSGALANAAVTAFMTTLLIAITGYISVHAHGTSYSDIPALILALPVAAASWIGFSEDTGKVAGTSLLGKLSLIASGLLSVAAIVLYLALASETLQAATLGQPSVSRLYSFEVFGIHNVWWNVLLELSFVNFTFTAFRFLVRLTYYNHLRVKPGFGKAEYGD